MKTITENFREAMRYEYPLTNDSMVIDAGAHVGAFASEIYRRYGCLIDCYEPMSEFFAKAVAALRNHKTIEVYNGAIGPISGQAVYALQGDSSGSFANGPTETVTVYDIEARLVRPTDLLKLNIEGAEYDLLDSMIQRDLMKHVRNLQVQFHRNVPDYVERHSVIRDGLLKTHHLTFDFPFCWENYELNE